jgi:hypothetical protein
MATYRTVRVSIVPRSQKLQEASYSGSRILPGHNEEENINNYSSSMTRSWIGPTSSFNQQSLPVRKDAKSHRKSIDLLFTIDLPQIPSTRQTK